MPARERVTRTFKASEARAHWSELLNQVFHGESRILVEKSGIPVAAIVSAEDLQRLRELDNEEARVLARMRSAFSELTEEQIVEDVAKVIHEVRAEHRQGRSTPASS